MRERVFWPEPENNAGTDQTVDNIRLIYLHICLLLLLLLLLVVGRLLMLDLTEVIPGQIGYEIIRNKRAGSEKASWLNAQTGKWHASWCT